MYIQKALGFAFRNYPNPQNNAKAPSVTPESATICFLFCNETFQNRAPTS